jgi:hypothetical protein
MLPDESAYCPRRKLDQTFQWRGQHIACGTMSLAALEALIAGVKVRCEVVERDRRVAKVFSPNGVDIGRRLVSAGWALAYRRYSMDYVAAEDVAGQLHEALGVARAGASIPCGRSRVSNAAACSPAAFIVASAAASLVALGASLVVSDLAFFVGGIQTRCAAARIRGHWIVPAAAPTGWSDCCTTGSPLSLACCSSDCSTPGRVGEC